MRSFAAKKAVARPARKPKVFKLSRFAKDAQKEGISDDALCVAIAELNEGKGDNLGGSVWKKRLNANRSRAIVLTRLNEFWVFVYLYAKSDRDNIDADELAAFKKLSADYGMAGASGMDALVAAGKAMEICHA